MGGVGQDREGFSEGRRGADSYPPLTCLFCHGPHPSGLPSQYICYILAPELSKTSLHLGSGLIKARLSQLLPTSSLPLPVLNPSPNASLHSQLLEPFLAFDFFRWLSIASSIKSSLLSHFSFIHCGFYKRPFPASRPLLRLFSLLRMHFIPSTVRQRPYLAKYAFFTSPLHSTCSILHSNMY